MKIHFFALRGINGTAWVTYSTQTTLAGQSEVENFNI